MMFSLSNIWSIFLFNSMNNSMKNLIRKYFQFIISTIGIRIDLLKFVELVTVETVLILENDLFFFLYRSFSNVAHFLMQSLHTSDSVHWAWNLFIKVSRLEYLRLFPTNNIFEKSSVYLFVTNGLACKR